MLICHFLVIPSTLHPTKVSQSYFYSLIQVWIYFQIKSAPWSRVTPDYYFCTFITDDKNNGWEKQRKHLQKQWQQIELTYFNKLNPSTPAENCHNLIYWFITKKHPRVAIMVENIRRLGSVCYTWYFWRLFSYKTHVYNLYLPTPLKSSSSSKSFFALLENLLRLPFI